MLPVVRRHPAVLKIKVPRFVQESCEQSLLRTSTIPSLACWLQYAAILLLSKLTVGRHEQKSYEQRLLQTSTTPSAACCRQYPAVLPSKLKFGRLAQSSFDQRPIFTDDCSGGETRAGTQRGRWAEPRHTRLSPAHLPFLRQ